jgi:2'-5' RNA ligase
MRTFLAVEIPCSIRRKIETLIKGLQQENLPIKWVTYENLHITLKFLGEIDENQKKDITLLMNKINKYEHFSVNLSSIGCFPNAQRPRVLWVGVEKGKDELTQIATDLDQTFVNLGFREEKRFHAHVTIGRTRKPCNIHDVLGEEFKSKIFPVDAIVLFKSILTPQGAVYQVLEKYKLG